MALTPEQIIKTAHEAGLYQDGINTQLPLWVLTHQELERFARAIEAEVRKQDDALIRQMHSVFASLATKLPAERPTAKTCYAIDDRDRDSIHSMEIAGRARLGEKT